MRRSSVSILVAAFLASGLALAVEPILVVPPLPVERTVVVEVAADSDADFSQQGGVLIHRDALSATWRVPEADLPALPGLGTAAIRPSANTLELRGFVIDTEAARIAETSATVTSASRLKVVQFASRPQQRDFEAITNAGITMIQAIPDHGFILWSPDEERDDTLLDIKAEHGWRYISDFRDEWKFAFSTEGMANEQFFRLEIRQVGAEEGIETDIEALMAVAQVTATRIDGIARASVGGSWGNLRPILEQCESVLTVSPVSNIKLLGETSGLALANRTEIVTSGILSGEQVTTPVTGSASTPPYIDWLRAAGRLDQGAEDGPDQYPIVAVIDNGIGSDTESPEELSGSGFDLDPFKPEGRFGTESVFREAGAEGPSRIDFSWSLDEDFFVNDLRDAAEFNVHWEPESAYVSHGHLAASVLAGNVPERTNRTTTDNGFLFSMGVNPWARIGNVKLTRGDVEKTIDSAQTGRMLSSIFRDGYTTATLSNTSPVPGERFQVLPHRTVLTTNSWGVTSSQGPGFAQSYDEVAAAYDRRARRAVTFDAADEITSGIRGLFSVAANGNEFIAPNSFSPAIGKNVLAVGGTGNTCNYFPWTNHVTDTLTASQPEYGYVGERTNIYQCGFPSSDADVNSLWAQSSRGKDTYARVKPDVVAPAQLVTGNVESFVKPFADSTPYSFVFGEAETTSTLLSDRPFLWAYTSGTSYATPAVAGAATLSAAYMRRALGVVEPSPALLRAYVMNHTKMITGAGTDIPNTSTFETLPSRGQGWGRPRLDMMLDEEPNNPAARYVFDQRQPLRQGEAWEVTGTIPDPTKPVRITMAYTDPPSDPGGSGPIVNNLDLLVVTEGIINETTPCNGSPIPGQFTVTYVGNDFHPNSETLSQFTQPRSSNTTVCRRDNANNVEAVVIPADGIGTDGAVTIRVEAVSVMMDAFFRKFSCGPTIACELPLQQDFAIVAYNFVPDTPKWEEMEGVAYVATDPCGQYDWSIWSDPNFRRWRINASPGVGYAPAIPNGQRITACEPEISLSTTNDAPLGPIEGRWSRRYASEPVPDRVFRDLEDNRHHAPARIYRAGLNMLFQQVSGPDTHEVELAFGTTMGVGPGLSRYLFPVNSPKPEPLGDSTRVWFVPKAYVGPELPEVPGYSMALREDEGSFEGVATLTLRGSELESLARKDFGEGVVLLNGGLATPETREVGPLTSQGLAPLNSPALWVQDECGYVALDGNGNPSNAIPGTAGGGLLLAVSGTSSGPDRFTASYQNPFILEAGYLYVVDVWIRADGEVQGLPKLDVRLGHQENCIMTDATAMPEAIATFELKPESEGGLEPGGPSRVYSHAFEVQREKQGFFYLRLDLHDDGDAARTFDGDFLIERVILREFPIP